MFGFALLLACAATADLPTNRPGFPYTRRVRLARAGLLSCGGRREAACIQLDDQPFMTVARLRCQNCPCKGVAAAGYSHSPGSAE